MLEAFKSHVSANFPELEKQRFLLACSGGLDSMVLTQLCSDAGYDFELAHCNFNLRGAQSDADQELVATVGGKLNIKVNVKSFDTIGYVNKNKVSVQMAARELRYRWFRDLTSGEGLDYVVTAHHRDDALETFLINLGRGSGLEGLCGIPDRSGNIRRPMLVFERSELEAFAAEKGVRWREDLSNTDTKYLRNRMRQQVIPALKAASPGFLGQFGKSLGHLSGSRALVGRYMEGIFHKVCRERDGVLVFSLPALRRLHPLAPHLHELFRGYGFTDWQAINRLMEAESGREVRSDTHRLLRNRGELLLKAIGPSGPSRYPIDPENPPEGLPLRLLFQEVPEMGEISDRILYTDKETLNKGLILRKWQKGDYFYPLGMNGRKKVSKFFKDSGLSQFRKETTWLLCSGSEVVWVVGQRADDRFKVTESTRRILKVIWEED